MEFSIIRLIFDKRKHQRREYQKCYEILKYIKPQSFKYIHLNGEDTKALECPAGSQPQRLNPKTASSKP